MKTVILIGDGTLIGGREGSLVGIFQKVFKQFILTYIYALYMFLKASNDFFNPDTFATGWKKNLIFQALIILPIIYNLKHKRFYGIIFQWVCLQKNMDL